MTIYNEIERRTSKGVYATRYQYNKGWEQKILIISDIHWDAKFSNHKLLKKHLDQALEIDAPVFIFGDLLDLMQGKQDPRGAKSTINPKYAIDDDYLGQVCEDAAEFLAPYSKQIKFISIGNHEFEYRRRHEICPLSIVSAHLRSKTGFAPVIAPYTGWIQFFFQYPSGGRRESYYLKYHHGVGSNAPVTRGAIQTNRFSVMYPNADIHVRGHIHQRYSMFIPRETINQKGTVVTDRDALHLQLGCYLQELDGDEWSQRRGFGTGALGGFWLRFYCDGFPKMGGAVRYQAIATD